MATRQLQTSHQPVTCEVCGRSLLRGEHATTFRGGTELHAVCELCTARALGEGWVREGAPITDAAQTRTVRARSLVGRLRARLDDSHAAASEERVEAAAPERHVRAVPADQRGQLARAVTLFNASEHRKTLFGVIRSLGAPYVHVGPGDSEVLVEIVVAWELCWYRYEVDLGDEAAGARVAAQGTELGELEHEDRLVNATADEHGVLSRVGV